MDLEELQAAMDKHRKERQKQVAEERERRRERDEPSGFLCVICGWGILTRYRHTLVTFNDHTPIGGQCWNEYDPGPIPHVDGYHCEQCGIEYRQLPKDGTKLST